MQENENVRKVKKYSLNLNQTLSSMFWCKQEGLNSQEPHSGGGNRNMCCAIEVHAKKKQHKEKA